MEIIKVTTAEELRIALKMPGPKIIEVYGTIELPEGFCIYGQDRGEGK